MVVLYIVPLSVWFGQTDRLDAAMLELRDGAVAGLGVVVFCALRVDICHDFPPLVCCCPEEYRDGYATCKRVLTLARTR
jgi:hypothetical protein